MIHSKLAMLICFFKFFVELVPQQSMYKNKNENGIR